MKLFLIALIVLTSLFALAKDKETIEQLQSRAESAEPKKKPKLYAQLADRQIEQADHLYNNDIEAAKKMVADGVESALLAAKNAIDTGKDLKHTEIRLRKLNDRIGDLQRSWAFEDRQVLKSGSEKIDEARSKLLDRMFKK